MTSRARAAHNQRQVASVTRRCKATDKSRVRGPEKKAQNTKRKRSMTCDQPSNQSHALPYTTLSIVLSGYRSYIFFLLLFPFLPFFRATLCHTPACAEVEPRRSLPPLAGDEAPDRRPAGGCAAVGVLGCDCCCSCSSLAKRAIIAASLRSSRDIFPPGVDTVGVPGSEPIAFLEK